MHFRHALMAAAAGAALLATDAAAQPATGDTSVEELVVTGTRTAGRSRLETVAPVDVINTEALARQGSGAELAQSLSNLTPSISFTRNAISDGSDHVRPATLRGLAPDQTLVLINGMRGHIGALVNVNSSIGRGSAPFDLNTIPTAAIDLVEVLRDGASAQYGADAIAGVINLRLREARRGGQIGVTYGQYDTEYRATRGKHSRNDGESTTVSGWIGLPLPNEGFATISAEYYDRQPTNRSDYVNAAALPLLPANTVLGRFGDPELESATVYVNAGLPLNDTWTLLGYAGYQDRLSDSAATPRAYNDVRNTQAIYPLGFTPLIEASIVDYNAQLALKGELAGWNSFFGVSYGKNALDYRTHHTVNTSFGAASPTSFDAGGLEYDQWLFNANFSRGYEVGFAKPLNVAAGLEYRRESFSVSAGEPGSYVQGPLRLAPGAQGFPGFRPSNEIDIDRDNYSAYVDIEAQVTDQFLVNGAVRYEDYSDFGDQITGRLAARFDFNEAFALRGAVSSGIKAPALQQQFFSYISTNNVVTPTGPVLQDTVTYFVSDPVARSLGARPLEPEESINYSIGFVFRHESLEVTVDAYQIDIENRIVLSENLPNPSTDPAAAAAITSRLPPSVTSARFFLNGVDTTTKGVDIVARYRLETETAGRFDFLAAINLNETEVTKTPALPNITGVSAPPFLFNRGNVKAFEEGTPEQKLVFSVDWTKGGWGVSAKATHYDSVLVANNIATLDYETGENWVADLEGRYKFEKGITVAVGANNLFDEYPNASPTTVSGNVGAIAFPQYSPFGFNGRFLYGRLSYEW
jgi:iron complex outermembrane recepter protein